MTEATLVVPTPISFSSFNLLADIIMSPQRIEANTEKTFIPGPACTITPPKVKEKNRHQSYDRILVIDGLPEVDARSLDHSSLERIVHHLKESFICGKFYDEELQKLCNQRKKDRKRFEFGFTITYLFSHNGKQQLTINFLTSQTSHSGAWGYYIDLEKISQKRLEQLEIKPNQFGFIPTARMSETEYKTVLDAFIRQCKLALQNYLNMVYNSAVAYQTEPDYYSIPTPKEKV